MLKILQTLVDKDSNASSLIHSSLSSVGTPCIQEALLREFTQVGGNRTYPSDGGKGQFYGYRIIGS